MKEKVLNIYKKAQIVAIIFNVVVYVVTIGIIIASPKVDDDVNYFLAACILIIVVAMTVLQVIYSNYFRFLEETSCIGYQKLHLSKVLRLNYTGYSRLKKKLI